MDEKILKGPEFQPKIEHKPPADIFNQAVFTTSPMNQCRLQRENDPPIPCNSGGHLIRRLYFSGILQATQPTAMEMLRDWRERAFSL
jgi:hypothetical protein